MDKNKKTKKLPLGKPVVCKNCGQGLGTLIRVVDHYEHKECGKSTDVSRDERRHPEKYKIKDTK